MNNNGPQEIICTTFQEFSNQLEILNHLLEIFPNSYCHKVFVEIISKHFLEWLHL